MPVLEWIGKSKVVNHHLDVPYHVLEKKYTFDAAGVHAEGGADDAVRALLAGALHYQPDYVCGHHKDEPPRVCGSHTCSAACYHETSEERSE